MDPREKLIGKKIGMLNVERLIDIDPETRKWTYICRCKCGRETIAQSSYLLREDVVQNCGCKDYTDGAVQYVRQKNRRTQMCWFCDRSTNPDGVCPWSSELKPVKGWIAQKIQRPPTGQQIEPYISYQISACPLFKEERRI